MDLSERMAAIRGRNTKPELEVRRLVHRLGYRFPATPERSAMVPPFGRYWSGGRGNAAGRCRIAVAGQGERPAGKCRCVRSV
jgi:hypothetical protein